MKVSNWDYFRISVASFMLGFCNILFGIMVSYLILLIVKDDILTLRDGKYIFFIICTILACFFAATTFMLMTWVMMRGEEIVWARQVKDLQNESDRLSDVIFRRKAKLELKKGDIRVEIK